MLQLLLLLVPIAFLLGWFLGQYNTFEDSGAETHALTPEYLLGVDYLVNERLDLALESLIKLIELKPSTAKLYNNLGALWRRRGELDQASSIHQKIMLDASLPPLSQAVARLELARDFKAAGMLDRSENLLRWLIKKRTLIVDALKELTELYQQQRQWKKALAAASFLERYGEGGEELKDTIAFINCERALQDAQHPKKQLIHLNRALSAAPNNVRATLALIDRYLASKQYAKAWDQIAQLLKRQPSLGLMMFKEVKECCSNDAYLAPLKNLMTHLALPISYYLDAELTGLIFSANEISALLFKRLNKSNVALTWYALGVLNHVKALEANDDLAKLYEATRNFKLETKYRCSACHMESRMLFWRCPSCSSLKAPEPFLMII